MNQIRTQYITKNGKRISGRVVSYDDDIILFMDHTGKTHVTHVKNFSPAPESPQGVSSINSTPRNKSTHTRNSKHG